MAATFDGRYWVLRGGTRREGESLQEPRMRPQSVAPELASDGEPVAAPVTG